MAAINFFGRFVIGLDGDGGGAGAEVYTVLPAAQVTVTPVARLYGGEGVVTLVDGTRQEAPRDASYHLDVDIRWEETGEAVWALLSDLLRDLVAASSGAVVKFYPKANTGLTAPDGAFAGITVVVDHRESTWPWQFVGRVRKREVRMVLKGKTLIATGSLPAWLFE